MIFVLVGPTASGKSTLEKMLEKVGLKRVISITTRKPRIGEINGKDYLFVNEETFYQLLSEDKLLEYTYYDGNYYGISSVGLDYIKDDYVAVVEPNGFRMIKEKIGNMVLSIFVDANENDRVLRMKFNRNMSSESIRRRLEVDKEKFINFKNEADFVVENNGFLNSIDNLVECFCKILKFINFYSERVNKKVINF